MVFRAEEFIFPFDAEFPKYSPPAPSEGPREGLPAVAAARRRTQGAPAARANAGRPTR